MSRCSVILPPAPDTTPTAFAVPGASRAEGIPVAPEVPAEARETVIYSDPRALAPPIPPLANRAVVRVPEWRAGEIMASGWADQ